MTTLKIASFEDLARLLAVANYPRAAVVPLAERLPAARAWLLENADLISAGDPLRPAVPYCWTRSVVSHIAHRPDFLAALDQVLATTCEHSELTIAGQRYHRQPIPKQQLHGYLVDFIWRAEHAPQPQLV